MKITKHTYDSFNKLYNSLLEVELTGELSFEDTGKILKELATTNKHFPEKFDETVDMNILLKNEIFIEKLITECSEIHQLTLPKLSKFAFFGDNFYTLFQKIQDILSLSNVPSFIICSPLFVTLIRTCSKQLCLNLENDKNCFKDTNMMFCGTLKPHVTKIYSHISNDMQGSDIIIGLVNPSDKSIKTQAIAVTNLSEYV